ncbi:outer membrane protein assembly factor BamE [Aurantiacibacter xanthus]|uniref:Outer membrane protein assembly factor BamE n=2 Tax=Aurantiacibacter xanthus TaxID=1784712 RepID=A0A3A1P5J5_9SPHN|nr:outer membrane protein assembly factor BamE [Aurantiacibacter xanthus]
MVATLAVLASACSSITNHRGYIVDETLVASVAPGLDNKQSVRGTLGEPTMISEFGDPVWYYISSRTKQAPFTRPRIDGHTVLAVHFDPAGNVTAAERTGMEQVVRLNPERDKTPTLGRHRGFLEDLFGNIGTVGAGGLGGGGAGS